MPREELDLVVRGGTVVTASSHCLTDVGVSGGRVVQIGGPIAARREVDASGKLVLPGGVDVHVHLRYPSDRGAWWVDDFGSGTRAAAAGGITTIGNMTPPRRREGLVALVERTAREAERSALVDFVLHPILLDPAPPRLAELPELARRGHTSVKIFMVLGNFDRRAGDHLRAMRRAGQLGMLPLVHCEDGCIVNHLVERLVASGRTGADAYPLARPVFSEEAAVARAIGFAEAAETPVYLVHVSSAAALDACRRARARGLPVYVETRPLYLYLTAQKLAEPDGAKYVGQPPLREDADVRALWHGLAAGDVQTVCTDHAPWRLADKLDPARTVADFRPGVADLDTLLPMLFSEGVKKGRISLHRFVEVTSTNAARLFGLFPRKGTIAVGGDADLVVWDPELTRPVESARTQTRSDYSPYEGWPVTGWPVVTISRGQVVYRDGRVVGRKGHGRLVVRGPTQRL
ncbi:MAG TPA: dihydropyrimidinase [Chloroflexota bacterium]|jgi:dihydropyrimidinase|nr:dihydropyrimidinase [Chloroflexota bacterium]